MSSFEMSSVPAASYAPPFRTNVDDGPSRPVENAAISSTPPSSSSDDAGMDMLMKPYSTLDEPVTETIMRDLRAVLLKLRVVMLPLDRQSTLGQLEYAGIKTAPSNASSSSAAAAAAGDGDDENNNGFTIDDAEANDEDDDDDDDADLVGDNQKAIIRSLREWDLWGPLLICLCLSVLLSLEANVEQASAVFATVFMLVWGGATIVTVNAQLLGGSISFFQSLCVLGYCVFPMTVAALLIAVLRHTPLAYFWVDCVWVALGFVWATRASTVFIGQYITKERRALAVFPVFFFYIFLSWMVLLI